MRKIHDFKPFIPSDDFQVSQQFYQHMGFKINWGSDEICEIDTQFGFRFLMLPDNHNNFAHSLMLHFNVDSADAWYQHFMDIKLTEHFPDTRVAKPELMPWGLLVCHVWDPAGVLLHFAEDPNATKL